MSGFHRDVLEALYGVGWLFVVDVWRRPVSQIFKVQAVQEEFFGDVF
jgi:hypothetical protein